MLEKTLESPLDCKEIQPVHPKGDPSWVFIGRTDIEAETPALWPPDAESWLIWKDPDAGKDWGQEEKWKMEDEMVGWHQWHNGHEFGWTPGVGGGQGGLVCCGSWGRKESDMTKWLNWTEMIQKYLKKRTSHKLQEKAYDCQKEAWGDRIFWEFEIRMYTLLYLKLITNKDLLCNTWNSVQYYVAAWMGGEFGAELIHVYAYIYTHIYTYEYMHIYTFMSKFHPCSPETITKLLID